MTYQTLPTYEKYTHIQRFIFHQYTTLPNKVGLIKIDKYNIKHCNLSTTPPKEDVMAEAYRTSSQHPNNKFPCSVSEKFTSDSYHHINPLKNEFGPLQILPLCGRQPLNNLFTYTH